jgi:beta-glucosidase
VTLNHFTAPRWFVGDGGWLSTDAPELYARQCERVMRSMGDGIDHTITFNEPNLFRLLEGILPPQVREIERITLDRAAQVTGSKRFIASNVVRPEDADGVEEGLLSAHAQARAAIKAIRPALPGGCDAGDH